MGAPCDQGASGEIQAERSGRYEIPAVSFEPRLKELLERLAAQTLSEVDYPRLENIDQSTVSVGGVGGLRAAASAGAPTAPDTWSFAGAEKSAAAAGSQEVTRRLVVFVLGGISSSELRAAAEVSSSLP